MNERHDIPPFQGRSARLIERLDRLVEAGRLSEEEAERLRTAAASGELDDAVRQIRLKHARVRICAAVEGRQLTQDEADAIVERLENGEDPRFLHALRRRLRTGSGGDVATF